LKSLQNRIEQYFDASLADSEVVRIVPHLMENDARFNAKATRKFLVERGINKNGFVRYCYRPFDVRWLYWEPETKLLDEKRKEYKPNVFPGNSFMVLAQRTRKGFEPPVVTSAVSSYHVIESVSLAFPIWLYPEFDTSSLFDRTTDSKPKLNLTEAAKEFLADLRLGNKPEELFYHTLAVFHSPEYGVENSGALRQDWPRVPLPKSREALLASAELGRQVAALLDTETPVQNVTAGIVRPELVKIAVVTRLNEKLNLSLTAGWGHAGQNGVTMPGKGRLETRPFTAEEVVAFDVAQASRLRVHEASPPRGSERETGGGTPPEPAGETPALPWLGPATHDIFLNEAACWQNVPEKVWAYTIGGYQVIKKWLSYREFDLLGRALTPDEAREVTHMARRIAALILLQPELDKNYQAVKAATLAL